MTTESSNKMTSSIKNLDAMIISVGNNILANFVNGDSCQTIKFSFSISITAKAINNERQTFVIISIYPNILNIRLNSNLNLCWPCSLKTCTRWLEESATTMALSGPTAIPLGQVKSPGWEPLEPNVINKLCFCEKYLIYNLLLCIGTNIFFKIFFSALFYIYIYRSEGLTEDFFSPFILSFFMHFLRRFDGQKTFCKTRYMYLWDSIIYGSLLYV